MTLRKKKKKKLFPFLHNSSVSKEFVPMGLTEERCKMRTASWENVEKHVAQYKIPLDHVSNDWKMWIKWRHTEIHNKIAIYVHYRSIYVKIPCIILVFVILNAFACKTNSVFNDFVNSCVTQMLRKMKVTDVYSESSDWKKQKQNKAKQNSFYLVKHICV